MYIKQHRILHPRSYLHEFMDGTNICVGISPNEHLEKIQHCGFRPTLNIGEQLIPAPIFGRVSRINAEGDYIVRRDLSKETIWRSVFWRITDWHGNEHTGYCDHPYERYPRDFKPAPCCEMRIVENDNGFRWVVSDFLVVCAENMLQIKSVINLFLEIFGECHILTEALIPQITAPIKRVQWEFLPRGNYPWESLCTKFEKSAERIKGNHGPAFQRFQFIASFGPTEIAVGEAGFKGYAAFRFPELNCCVLESVYPDNATYVFGNRWEELTRFTKAEVIKGNLHHLRIVHSANWKNELQRILRSSSDERIAG